MTQSLHDRINQQCEWTFRECLGLATEFNVKVRVVVATVLAQGKHYIDREEIESDSDPCADGRSQDA